jgi:hypothetical protein
MPLLLGRRLVLGDPFRTPREGVAVELNLSRREPVLSHYRLPTFKTVWTKVRKTAFVVGCLRGQFGVAVTARLRGVYQH